MRPASALRHPSAPATTERLRSARVTSPARAALGVGALGLASTAALALWRPDLGSMSAPALAGAGVAATALAAGAGAERSRSRRRLFDSETAWVARAIEREGRLRSIVASLQDGLILYDRHLRIVEFNPAAERILALDDDMRGRVPTALPGWRALREDGSVMAPEEFPVLQTMCTGRSISDRVVGIEREGRGTSWVSVNTQPVRGVGGRVDGVVQTFTDLTSQLEAQRALASSEALVDEATEMLAWQAYHDPLTRLPNRALLLDRLSTALDRGRERGTRSALLFLDLDRFKNVNDTLGHDAGDRLLVTVAERLRGALRPSDTVARLGGDEFVVLLEALGTRQEASVVADRLRAAIAEPTTLDGTQLTVTTSVGIAFDADHQPTTLLRDADTALYEAKDSGRDRWAVFDDSLRAATIRRVAAEQLIRQALDEDGLRVHYQPIVDLVTGRVIGAEALLRMMGPHNELLMPGSFISIAEETGLIVPVGAGVLDDACAQLRRWRKELGDDAPATVSVNLAARQLSTAGFAELVRRTLERHRIEPADLTLELTESTLIQAGREALDAVVALHDLGVRLAIDDFGTGYSSLSYLKRFPVDIVKVDRNFVDGLGNAPNDTEIVRAVLALGQSLGLVTVAEGVETKDQLQLLRELGCDGAQGYLLSRPVPAAELPAAVVGIHDMTSHP